MSDKSSLFDEICSLENLELAFEKAKKGKGKKPNITKFEDNIKEELHSLRSELLLKSYSPKPLCTFIVRDPKTRKISASAFRDRVVHHAICNVIEPIFDRTFIYDSYANRKRKGTIAALKRLDCFKRKVSKNNTRSCFVLKADIKHYFQTVDQEILLDLINKKICDKEVMWLIRKIIKNYSDKQKGMPLGNLTSQFFANLYLNELDQYVKHKLKINYYIRYVDDFVILHYNRDMLDKYKMEVNNFLKEKLKIELHPDKSKIICLDEGINFLGFRIFYYHKLLKKSNLRKINKKFRSLKDDYDKGKIDYGIVCDSLEGWVAYAKQAKTYKLRKKFSKEIEKNFPNEISTKEINRAKK